MTKLVTSVVTLLVAVVVLMSLVTLYAVPIAYLLMLFTGNLGIPLSFVESLQGAILLRVLFYQGKINLNEKEK